MFKVRIIIRSTIIFGIVSLGVFLSVGAQSADFCVNTIAELQSALSTAEANGADDTIKVVQGTYNSNFNYSSDQGNSIAVLGGYTSECNDRVLSPENTILDSGGSHRPNNVLSLYLENGGNIIVEGLTIQNGSIGYEGGGLYARSFSTSSSSGDITISSNIIAGNHADTKGGGIFAYSYSTSSSAGSVIFADNIITGNSANENGGGASAVSQSDPGMGGSVTLTNNTFSNNTSAWGGSGVRVMAHSNNGTAGTVDLTGNIFTGNIASSSPSVGGGVDARSYSVSGTASLVAITNNKISGNSSGQDGGGIVTESMGPVQSGDVILTGNIIIGNSATRWYGGLRASSGTSTGTSGDVVLVNNIIAQNSSGVAHGGAYVSSTSATGAAGTITLTNNTIAGNSAGGLAGGVSINMDDNIFNCYNNIIRGNTAPSIMDIDLIGTGSTNGYNNNYSTMSGSWSNEGGNIDVTPGFVNELNGNYHLKIASQSIDKGDNGAPQISAIDFEGDDRIIDGDDDGTATVDMGADEYMRKINAMPWILLPLLNY